MDEIIASLLCQNGPMTAEDIRIAVARLAQVALAGMVKKGTVREVIGEEGLAYDVDA